MFIIGLIGHSRRGKDTVADFIVAALSEHLERTRTEAQVYKLSFAAPLYTAVYEMLKKDFGDDIEPTRQWLNDNKEDVLRPILQGYGELRRRKYGEDYWITRLIYRLSEEASNAFVVIPDCRYPNEAQWIADTGGVLVGVRGPFRGDGPEKSDHSAPSERQIDSMIRERANFIVRNNTTLFDLDLACSNLVRYLLGLVDAGYYTTALQGMVRSPEIAPPEAGAISE